MFHLNVHVYDAAVAGSRCYNNLIFHKILLENLVPYPLSGIFFLFNFIVQCPFAQWIKKN